jgi:hypothetical protein
MFHTSGVSTPAGDQLDGESYATEGADRMGRGTDLPESHTHSFIVKIWLEETLEEDGRAIWRGYITHVPGGERRYLKRLNDILIFIMPFLNQMGVRSSLLGRMQQWLKRLKPSRMSKN